MNQQPGLITFEKKKKKKLSLHITYLIPVLVIFQSSLTLVDDENSYDQILLLPLLL